MKPAILLSAMLFLAACTGEVGPSGPAGPVGPGTIETYTGAIHLDRTQPTSVSIPNAANAAIVVYTYLPADDAWIMPNAYAEDINDDIFLAEFFLVYQSRVDIYSASGTLYRVYAICGGD